MFRKAAWQALMKCNIYMTHNSTSRYLQSKENWGSPQSACECSFHSDFHHQSSKLGTIPPLPQWTDKQTVAQDMRAVLAGAAFRGQDCRALFVRLLKNAKSQCLRGGGGGAGKGMIELFCLERYMIIHICQNLENYIPPRVTSTECKLQQ